MSYHIKVIRLNLKLLENLYPVSLNEQIKCQIRSGFYVLIDERSDNNTRTTYVFRRRASLFMRKTYPWIRITLHKTTATRTSVKSAMRPR